MTDWQDLQTELDAWNASGLQATFWWRDDDAVQPTPQLEQLLALANKYQIPLLLAVIPSKTGEELAKRLRAEHWVSVAQHGYAHINHEKDRGRASEFGPSRSQEAVCAELQRGWQHLSALFGDQLLPWLVPPWNRIEEMFMSLLPDLGYQVLSGFDTDPTQKTLEQRDVHCDVVKWRPVPHFRGEARCLHEILQHLQVRRQGNRDRELPTGLLTHHLDHDAECFDFVQRFFATTKTHPAVRWLDLRKC